jgi:hypothetical protein
VRSVSFTHAIVVLIVLSQTISQTEAQALQQVAGEIIVTLRPGETEAFRWGLLSDSDQQTRIELRAEGEGAEFLSIPNSVTLEPETFYWVDVNVTIPAYHPGSMEVQPSLFATELGKEGGATVINIQMQKIVQLRILPNPDPSFTGKSQLLFRDYPQVIAIGGNQVNLLIQSASEISDFNFDQASKKVSFQVSGGESTVVEISSVLDGPYAVSIDGDRSVIYESSVSDDGRESIRISHDLNTHTITITGMSVVPEFTLPLIMLATVLMLMIASQIFGSRIATVH